MKKHCTNCRRICSLGGEYGRECVENNMKHWKKKISKTIKIKPKYTVDPNHSIVSKKSGMAAVTQFWRENYSNGGLCCLCNNDGIITYNPHYPNLPTAFKLPTKFCLCPNGQAMKKDSDKSIEAERKIQDLREHYKI